MNSRTGGVSSNARVRGIALLLFLSLLVGAEPVLAKKVALVLGNEDYTQLDRLKNPVNDATDVAMALRDLGFRLVGKDDGSDGAAVLNQDLAGMLQALERFGSQAQGAELALVYYAGHGATIDEQSYLLPVTARSPVKDNKLIPTELKLLKRESLPLSEVIDYMSQASGGKIAVFDACREVLKLTQRNLLGGGTSQSLLRGGLTVPGGTAQSLLVAFSGAAGQLVQDGNGRNSPYTGVLLEQLRNVKQRDVGAFFGDVGYESARRLSDSVNAQTPVVELRGLESGRYFLADGVAVPQPDKPVVPDQAGLIREIQKELTRLGYSLGDADGQMGHRTIASIKAFERSQGLSVTGSATEALLERLVVAKGAVGVKPDEPVAEDKWSNSLGMEFVTIPVGKFRMGDLSGKGDGDEKPVHDVQIRRPFAMMTTEVTWSHYQPCIDAGACPDNSGDGGDNGWGKGNRPVIEVSWDDTQKYIKWLNQETGERYRLPSEAEWEYAARARTTTEYAWGNEIGRGRANCDGCGSKWDNKTTAPVKSFAANEWGLYDMHGNVWEWVEDTLHDSYSGHSGTESAWVSGDTTQRVLRGGSWYSEPVNLRAALRGGYAASARYNHGGFRLVQGR